MHRVIDHSETVRYAATCLDEASTNPADHVHFKCTACQHIYCLSQVAVPAVDLPGPYQVLRRDCLLLGVCAQCQAPAPPPAAGQPMRQEHQQLVADHARLLAEHQALLAKAGK